MRVNYNNNDDNKKKNNDTKKITMTTNDYHPGITQILMGRKTSIQII